MTKLTGKDALDRTAAILLTRAQSRLVVRAASYYADWPMKQIVSIYLLSYCKVPHGDHGDFFEVIYGSQGDPTSWYSSDNALEVRLLHPDFEHEDFALWQWLRIWGTQNPLWVDDREIVAYTQGPLTKPQEVYPSNLQLMLHFTRLHGLILERGHHTLNAWETDDLLKRLGAFLKDRIQDWEKVIG